MTRSPLFNFLLGIAAGACVAGAVTVHTATARAQQKATEIDKQIDSLADDVKRLAGNAEEWKHRAEEMAARAEKCDVAYKAAAEEQSARDFRDSWYTLVYEPGSAQDNAAAPLELLNLVRPGLGTMLARMQTQQPAGQQLRYVLRGYVESAVPLPAGVHFVRTLDAAKAAQ
jgi:hypothetical protein